MQKFNKKEGKSLFFLPWCRVRLRDERAGLVKMKGKRA